MNRAHEEDWWFRALKVSVDAITIRFFFGSSRVHLAFMRYMNYSAGFTGQMARAEPGHGVEEAIITIRKLLRFPGTFKRFSTT